MDLSPTTPSPASPPINTSVALLNSFGCPCQPFPDQGAAPSSPSSPVDATQPPVSKESILLWVLIIWFFASMIGVKMTERYWFNDRRRPYGYIGLAVIALGGLVKTVAAQAATAPIPTVTAVGREKPTLTGYRLTPMPTAATSQASIAAPSFSPSIRYWALMALIVTVIVASTVNAKYAALVHQDALDKAQTDLSRTCLAARVEDKKSQTADGNDIHLIFAKPRRNMRSAGVTRMAALLVCLIVMACLMPVILAGPTGTSAMTATASAALITGAATLNNSNGTWWVGKDKPQSWFVNAGSLQTANVPLLLATTALFLVTFAGRAMAPAILHRRQVPAIKALALMIVGLAIAACLPGVLAQDIVHLNPAIIASMIENSTANRSLTWVPAAVSDATGLCLSWPTITLGLISVAVVGAAVTGHGFLAAVILALTSLLPHALAQANGPVTIAVPNGPGVYVPHNAGTPRLALSWMAVVVALLCLLGTTKASISLPSVLESEAETATANAPMFAPTVSANATTTLATSAGSANRARISFNGSSGRSAKFGNKTLLFLAVVCLLAFLVPLASAQRTYETTDVTVMVGTPIQHTQTRPTEGPAVARAALGITPTQRTRPTEGLMTARAALETPPPTAYTAVYVDAANVTKTLTISEQALTSINWYKWQAGHGNHAASNTFRVDWKSMTAALWGFAAGVALILDMLV